MGDLDKLIAAVEAGTFAQTDFSWGGWHPNVSYDDARGAFCGSLDAALRLHESLLPGWDVTGLDQASNLAGSPWGCSIGYFDGTNPNNNRKAYSGHNFDRNPARAWLLAILRALQAQSTPPISPEQAQFNAIRHHERFGPLDEKGNPLDPRRRG